MDRIRRRTQAALLLASLLGVASCSTELTSLENETIGNYNLRYVEGDELPYPVGESEGQLIDVLAGRIELHTDRTCQFNHTFRIRNPNEQTSTTSEEKKSCTWSMNQAVVSLKFGTGDSAGFVTGIAGIEILVFDFTFDPFAVRFIYERENSARTPQ
jgi:hypothetical protein